MINVLQGSKSTLLRRSELPDRIPARTNVGVRWKGIPHRDLAEGIVKAIESAGIDVSVERWTIDQSGWCLTGGLQLSVPRKLKLRKLKDATYAMGLIHSNDGRRALRIAGGAQIFVCQNGMLSGEFIVKRKHTTGLRLDEMLTGAVDRLLTELGGTAAFIDEMQKRALKPAVFDEIAMEIGRRHLIPWSHVGKMDREYHQPTFEQFIRWHGTAYGAYNAFNYITQQSTPHQQMRALGSARDLFASRKKR